MNKYARIIIMFVVFSTMFYTIEKEQDVLMRTQNKLVLDSTVDCLKKNIQDEKELYDELTKCGLGRLSLGETGDMFVIRKKDLLLFWDNSSDCRPSNSSKLYMTKNGVCSLFNKQNSCVEAVEFMRNNEHGFVKWMFDDSEETIYFRTIKVNGEEYILGQGSQRDEADRYYNVIRYAVFVAFTIIGVIYLF